jgi:LysM repeat protein
MNKINFVFFLITFILISCSGKTQDSLYEKLKIDTTYCNLNFYSNKTAKQFQKLFKSTQQEKLVVFHYGGSHIQAEMPTTVARENLTQIFGDGGRGMIFPYNIANTYSSVNYSIKHIGKWKYGKSFQFPAPIPLGVCGMAVQTKDTNAQVNFKFKNTIQQNNYELKIMMNVDELSPTFKFKIDTTTFFIDERFLKENLDKGFISVNYSGTINEISIELMETDTSFKFSFYGINIETQKQSGVVYHSLGVGAAPFRSVLNIENLEKHAAILKPNLVILDFGTNDILFKNAIDEKLSEQIEKSIERFRKLNPDILIVLTSTQDLFYKKKFITAGVSFRNLIDSLAKKNDCLFWNWYDLSGGYGTIKIWDELGCARKDGIHLTHDGYKIKGKLLFNSIINTLKIIEKKNDINMSHSGLKFYELKIPSNKKEANKKENNKKQTNKFSSENYHRVKSGETLSSIAKKHKTSVRKIKELNKLRTDRIAIGETLKIK